MATKPTATAVYTSNVVTGLTSLANITRVDWSIGRQNITDQWASGTCRVYGRGNVVNPGGVQPTIGFQMRVRVTDGSNEANFYGWIQDVRQIYGIKTNLDTYEITLEGTFAVSGRNTGTITTVAGASTQNMLTSIRATYYGGDTFDMGGWGSTTSAQTYTGQIADAFTDLLETEQGVMKETGEDIPFLPPTIKATVEIYGRNATGLYQLGSNVFADDGSVYNSITGWKYSDIEFLSQAANYGSKVVVQAAGFADQSSGTGTYAQTFSTINGSATEAANLAGYIKTQLNLAGTVPYRLSFSGASNTASTVFLADRTRIKESCWIKFRGTAYTAVIEGIEFSADASNWECTWYLSSSLANAFLKLDNPILGTLDTNKLGF